MRSKNQRRLYAFGGLFLAAILPFLMYKIVRSLSDDKISLPSYLHPIGVDTTIGEDGQLMLDTLYHTVDNFQLTTQLDRPFDLYRYTRDQIVVAHVFHRDSAETFPLLMAHTENLQYAFRKRDTILRILSITGEPQVDDVPQLRSYAQQYHANHDMWIFVTGDEKNIQKIVTEQLHLNPKGDNDILSIPYSQYYVLLDFHKHIRGYYDALDTMELKRLKDDIALLPLEKNPKP